MAPVLGAGLARPALTWPRLFAGTIFDTYPYALPCIAAAIIPGVTVLFAIFLSHETHPGKRAGGVGAAEYMKIPNSAPSSPALLKSRVSHDSTMGQSSLGSREGNEEEQEGMLACGAGFILLMRVSSATPLDLWTFLLKSGVLWLVVLDPRPSSLVRRSRAPPLLFFEKDRRSRPDAGADVHLPGSSPTACLPVHTLRVSDPLPPVHRCPDYADLYVVLPASYRHLPHARWLRFSRHDEHVINDRLPRRSLGLPIDFQPLLLGIKYPAQRSRSEPALSLAPERIQRAYEPIGYRPGR